MQNSPEGPRIGGILVFNFQGSLHVTRTTECMYTWSMSGPNPSSLLDRFLYSIELMEHFPSAS